MLPSELVPASTCKLCETRRPRRACPGVGGDICALCCGAEREVSVSCPFECAYLEEARQHEKPVEVKPEELPNQDVKLSERFLAEHSRLVSFAGVSLLDAALKTPGAVDADVREALESLARTYRTRESGLYYESRPANLLAAAIHQRMQQSFAEYQQRQSQQTGVGATRDAELLGVLVFWQLSALANDNGRRLGRSFLSHLRESAARSGLAVGSSGVQRHAASPLLV